MIPEIYAAAIAVSRDIRNNEKMVCVQTTSALRNYFE
jgi:hypothetical protein